MTSRPQLPPQPKDSQLKQALGLGIGIWDYMEKNQRELGDTFTLKLPGQGPMVWTAEQDVIRDVLKLREDQYDASLVQLPVDVGEQNTVFLNDKPGFDASAWKAARVSEAPLEPLKPILDMPPVRATETIRPVAVTSPLTG